MQKLCIFAKKCVTLHEQNTQRTGNIKLLPIGDCEGFDPFGKGCPGHEQKEALWW